MRRVVRKMRFLMKDRACEQLIVVEACGPSAKVHQCEKIRGVWRMRAVYDGHIGRNGVTADKREGDGKTPAGLYALDTAFGNKPNPGTAMDYRDVTGESYYVDDPRSRFYNTWVEGVDGRDWASAERLADYPDAYAYGVVIDYNAARVPGAGSAIFLHCGASPTAGCVAVARSVMVGLLQWLHPKRSPHIVIQ